jgi:hypothetical protein
MNCFHSDRSIGNKIASQFGIKITLKVFGITTKCYISTVSTFCYFHVINFLTIILIFDDPKLRFELPSSAKVQCRQSTLYSTVLPANRQQQSGTLINWEIVIFLGID